MATKAPIIGIDFGTTYSCVGVVRHKAVDIIANDQGARTTPSVVAFTETETLTGEAAKNQVARNPRNTIFDIKQILGKKYSDPATKEFMKAWPLQIEEGEDGKPVIVIEVEEKERKFSPEDIAGIILSRMKEIAESYLTATISRAVLTCPLGFDAAQRQALLEAAKKANLEVVRIISEPAAALLAYGFDQPKEEDGASLVAVVDVGGGSADVSLVSAQDGLFEVKANASNIKVGGEEFDLRMVDLCAAEFKRKHKIDLKENRKSIIRLRAACEHAKRVLSSSTQAAIEVESIYEGMDFNYTITQARFDMQATDLFKECIKPIEQVLAEAGVEKKDVEAVILAGGATKIPRLQQIITDYFGVKPLKTLNPDEVSAYGAAMEGAILEQHAHLTADSGQVSVSALSLGLEVAGGLMSVVVPRNTPLPARKTVSVSTYKDAQDSVFLQLYEGERSQAQHNRLLAKFELAGIPPAPRGSPKILVTFDVSKDGVLTVDAVVEKSGKPIKLVISSDKETVSAEVVKRAMADAVAHKTQDQDAVKKIQALDNLVCYHAHVVHVRSLCQSSTSGPLSTEEISLLSKGLEEATRWLEKHQLDQVSESKEKEREESKKAKHHALTVDEIDRTLKSFEKACDALVNKATTFFDSKNKIDKKKR